MADIKWIKLTVGMFNHRKIEQIEAMPDGDGVIVIWIKLLCLAGSVNDNGQIYFTQEVPYTDEMLATHFHRPIQLVKMALTVFERFGMISIINDIIHVTNWEKYQSVERMQQIREYNRLAQQKSRERRKLYAPVNDMSMTSQRGHDTDIDIDRELDIEVDRNTKIGSTGAGAPAPSPIKDPKHEYGDNGWVKLTDKQHNKLINDLGQAEFERCVSYVDESAQISTNKNGWKDWNAVLRKAHREGWGVKKSWSKPISEKDNVNKVYDESRPF